MVYYAAALSIFPFAMILAGISDLFTMTIPNKISLALLIGFFLLAPFSGMGWDDLAYHLAAFSLVFSICLAMFAFGWIGGGDAKLMAVTALWLGFDQLMDYVLIASVAGGALTLAILFARKLPVPTILCRYQWITRLHDRHTGIPYGIALATAGLAVYPASIWVIPS